MTTVSTLSTHGPTYLQLLLQANLVVSFCTVMIAFAGVYILNTTGKGIVVDASLVNGSIGSFSIIATVIIATAFSLEVRSTSAALM